MEPFAHTMPPDRLARAVQRLASIRALALAAAVLHPAVAGAQDAPAAAASVAAGAGWRGAGRIHECCGPLQSDADGFRSWWIAGSISRGISSRIGVTGEAT